MELMQDVVGLNRSRLFVGRENELRHLDDWLSNPYAPTTVYSLHGIGGVGKSALMSEMVYIAKERGVIALQLDGRAGIHTPTGFLDYLGASIQVIHHGSQTGESGLHLLFETSPAHRVMLCIDNYEALSGIEGWLFNAFFPRLSSSGILVVVASRNALSLTWRTDLAWSDHVVEFPLQNFTRAESMLYLTRFAYIDSTSQGALIRVSGGHPLALALFVESMKSRRLEQHTVQSVAHTVTGHLLRELVTDDLQESVDVLTLVSVANFDLLSAALTTPITVNQYHVLSQLSFIKPTPSGLAIHDVARAHLLADFQVREPHRIRMLRAKLLLLLQEQLNTGGRTDRPIAASQLLTLCLDVLPTDEVYANLKVDPHLFRLDSYHTRDLRRLHVILDHWCDHSVDPDRRGVYHAFFDRWSTAFPQTIRVIRSPQGTPIAMFIMTLLYDSTSSLLREFFQAELDECCTEEEYMCVPDEADTYYAVLGAFDKENEEYTGAELVGALVRDHLPFLGNGTRVVLVATNESLKVLLTQLGFEMREAQSAECSTSFAQAHVLELDLRNRNFGDWVASLMEPGGVSRESSPRNTAPVTDEMVRDALSNLLDATELNDSDLAKHLNISGRDLQQLLHHLLTDTESPVRVSHEQQTVLRITYVDHARSPQNAATACNMSRATYYRHLRAAIQKAAQVIDWVYLYPRSVK